MKLCACVKDGNTMLEKVCKHIFINFKIIMFTFTICCVKLFKKPVAKLKSGRPYWKKCVANV